MTTLAALTAQYHERGWCLVPRCLDGTTVRSFVDQLKRELKTPTVPGESGHDYRAIDLENSETWFRGTERRVVEVNPPGAGDHWARIEAAPRLVAALDALLGAWALPRNDAERTRQWYCPIVFPEDPPERTPARRALQGEATWCAGQGRDWTAAEDARLRKAARAVPVDWKGVSSDLQRPAKHCRERSAAIIPWSPAEDHALVEIHATHGDSWSLVTTKLAAAGHESRTKRTVRARCAHLASQRVVEAPPTLNKWRPVNRRRCLDRGFHVDPGPGFPMDGPRTVHGDRAQGAVVLIVLSDLPRNGGGTCVANRSHRWVGAKLEECPLRHAELNRWAIGEVARRREEGLLRLDHEVGNGEVIEQIVARAGDVVLMHPWAVHGGTTNLLKAPRVMANGMAQVSNPGDGAFLQRAVGPCDEAAFAAGAASVVAQDRVRVLGDSRRSVAYVHIPKTGGSAVEAWLREAWPRRVTLSGHHKLTLGAHQRRCAEAVTLVTLREPLERFESTHAYWVHGAADEPWHRRGDDWVPGLGGAAPGFDLRDLGGFVAAARAGAIDLEAWDDWFGCAPFRRQVDWLQDGDISRVIAVRYASDSEVFAERVAGAVQLALGETADAQPMRVVNATRWRTQSVLSSADAAWVRERYAADVELWASVNAGGGRFRDVC